MCREETGKFSQDTLKVISPRKRNKVRELLDQHR